MNIPKIKIPDINRSYSIDDHFKSWAFALETWALEVNALSDLTSDNFQKFNTVAEECKLTPLKVRKVYEELRKHGVEL